MLIRLCECTTWSAPLLFANPEHSFSLDKVQMKYKALFCFNIFFFFFFFFGGGGGGGGMGVGEGS